MNNNEFDANVSTDFQNYEVKKNRKANIFAFILCVIIAFSIWVFAWNNDRPKDAPTDNGAQPPAAEAVELSQSEF